MSYKIFKRSATSFEAFCRARCWHICFAASLKEAQEICRRLNDDRTPAQVRAGTKYEFTSGPVK